MPRSVNACVVACSRIHLFFEGVRIGRRSLGCGGEQADPAVQALLGFDRCRWVQVAGRGESGHVPIRPCRDAARVERVLLTLPCDVAIADQSRGLTLRL